MATSIDDLLGVLQTESSRGRLDSGQCVQALRVTARILNRLRPQGVGTPDARGGVTRRLADACTEAAITFEASPGRLGDLFGVASDAVGRRSYQLTDDERWAVVTRLAPLTRRLAHHIGGSGPYRDVPQLLGLADRSRELIATAARYPANPDQLGALQVPIPSAVTSAELPAARALSESMARLVAEFHRTNRRPMTIRQMVAATHAAEAVTRLGAELVQSQDPRASEGGAQTPNAWPQLREFLVRITDDSRGRPEPNDPTLDHALQVHAAAHRIVHSLAAGTSKTQSGALVDAINQALTMVPMLAAGLERDLLTPAQRFVADGALPLHEDRVAEWLQHRRSVVRKRDLRPARTILHESIRESTRLHRALASNESLVPLIGCAEVELELRQVSATVSD